MLKTKTAEVLQGVLDAMQDMLRVLDLSQHVVMSNQSYARCFGSQVGCACSDMFCVGSPCRNCVSKQALATGNTHQKNKRFRGRTYWVNASPLYDSEGNSIGTVEVFRDITDQLKQQEALRAQNKRLLRESNLAARMQRELFLAQGLPDARVSVISRYLPASSLGGDMFGCFKQQDGRLCFYVADVAGHGMAAAMITLLLANALRGIRANSAVHMLYKAREAFLSMVNDIQIYVSMFVAILDPATGKLEWSNAGLNAVPLLVGNDGMERLYAPSLPICSWEEVITYYCQESYMPEDGRLLLYTDGLLDPKSSRLTEEELERRAMRQSGEILLAGLEKQVLTTHEDDVCMLLITRLSAAGAVNNS